MGLVVGGIVAKTVGGGGSGPAVTVDLEPAVLTLIATAAASDDAAGCLRGELAAYAAVSATFAAYAAVSASWAVCGEVVGVGVATLKLRRNADNVIELRDLTNELDGTPQGAATVTLTGTDVETGNVVIGPVGMTLVPGSPDDYRVILDAAAEPASFVDGQRIELVAVTAQGGVEGRHVQRAIVSPT